MTFKPLVGAGTARRSDINAAQTQTTSGGGVTSPRGGPDTNGAGTGDGEDDEIIEGANFPDLTVKGACSMLILILNGVVYILVSQLNSHSECFVPVGPSMRMCAR